MAAALPFAPIDFERETLAEGLAAVWSTFAYIAGQLWENKGQ